MLRVLKKWGEGALAALCVAAILFAALYTRQDDLKRMAAQNAAASQDETLEQAAEPPAFQRPTTQAPAEKWMGAWRSEAGIWRFSPALRYQTAFDRRVYAMGAGTVIRAEDGAVCIQHPQGVETRCQGLDTLAVRAGEAVQAGQLLGTAREAEVRVEALRGDSYIDPESLLE